MVVVSISHSYRKMGVGLGLVVVVSISHSYRKTGLRVRVRFSGSCKYFS